MGPVAPCRERSLSNIPELRQLVHPFTHLGSWIRDRVTDVPSGQELVMRCHWNIARKWAILRKWF